MWATDQTFDSDAPVEALWPLYTSAEAWPRWSDDIEWADALGRLEAGMEGRGKYAGLPTGPYEGIGVDPPRRFSIRLRVLLTTIKFDHPLAAHPGGPRIGERTDLGRPPAPPPR